jgi:hypothetical protein
VSKEIRKARLADIEVDEVSFVDKAANKRKFLFMKRDTSEDKGGENLELLKAFKNDEAAIEALEGIEEHLTAFDILFDKKLEDASLTEEQKALLLEKRAQYEELKELLEDGFEELFLGKTAFSSNGGADGKGNETAKGHDGSTGDEPTGVQEEEEVDTDEQDGGEDRSPDKGNPTSKGKGGKGKGGGLPEPLAGVKKGKKKPADDNSDEDEEDESNEDDMDESDEEEGKKDTKKPTKKSDEDEEESDDLDEEEVELLEKISSELQRGEKLRKEVRQQNSQAQA